MQTFRRIAIFLVLIVSLPAAWAENTATPKPEDAEKNAFQTPTTGKQDAPGPGRTGQNKSDANPESRMNDEAPANEKPGPSNNAGK